MKQEKEVIFKTQFELDKCLAKWMALLDLEDWEIYIEFNNNIDYRGIVNYEFSLKQARIFIIEADEYYKNCSGICFDMEKIIVHELIHIMFSPVDKAVGKKTMKRIAPFEERFVNDMADKLVMIERARNVSGGKTED